MKTPLPPNQFKITCDVKKFWTVEKADGTQAYWIGGRASGTNLDLDEEQMAKSAILAFEDAIKNGIVDPYTQEFSFVPLRQEHRGGMFDVLGYVKNASVDENFDLWIEAELDPDSSFAMDLWKKLNRKPEYGKPLHIGFSVAGKIASAGKEWVESLKRFVTTFYKINLTEISVTSSPANPTAYVTALAKSLDLDALAREGTAAAAERPSTEVTKETTPMLENDELTEQVEEKTTDATVTDAAADENVAKAEETETQEVATSESEAGEDVSDPEAAKATDPEDGESTETDAAAKATDQSLDEATKKSLTDFTSGVMDAIRALTYQIENMCSQIGFLISDHQMVEDAVGGMVAYSQEGDEPDLNKEHTMDNEAIAKAVAEAVEGLKGDFQKSLDEALATQKADLEKGYGEQIEALKGEIETLKAEPVAKGIAVNKEKEEGEEPVPFRQKAKDLKGRAILRAALGADAA